MHVLFAHVPYFLHTHKSLRVFTGQGVEKNNDSARNVVLRKSNHFDSVGDILRIENRCLLRERERAGRKYTKQNTQYWGKKSVPSVQVKREDLKQIYPTWKATTCQIHLQPKVRVNNTKQKLAQIMKGQQIKEERIWGVGEKETEKGKERVNKQNRKKESSLSSYMSCA